MNDDFDAISMTERNCVTPISKVETHVLDKLGVYSLSCRLTFDCFCLPSFYVLFSNPIEINSPRTFLKLFKSPTASVLNREYYMAARWIRILSSSAESISHE